MLVSLRRWWLLLVLCLGVLVVRAHAGDEDERRRLLEEIDEFLEDTAGDLDGLESDSSASDVDRAIDRVERVKDRARALERVAGDDARAREIGSRYPGYADRFRDAALALRELKDSQRSLDEQPRQCEDRSRELAEKIRGYLDRDDPAGVTEVPRLAVEIGKPIAEMLDKTARRRDELGRLRERARAFSESDGRWAAVRGELHASTDEIFDLWTRRHDETKRTCEELARLDRSRIVEDALKRLANSEAGRQAIYKELAEEIADSLRLLTDIEADGNDADVKQAERNVDDLRRLLDRLRAAQGEDRKAKEMSERWPRELEALERALLALDELKDYQFRADRAPERCQAEDDRIARAAADLERLDPVAGDPGSIDRTAQDLESTAKTAGDTLGEALRKAAEGKAEADKLAGQARAWSPAIDELRAVDEELDESADDVQEHLAKATETATTVCAAPALGTRHPAAVRARKRMFGDCTHDEYRPYRDEVTRHCRNIVRKCEPSDSCDELRRKIGLFDSCIKARTDLTDRCYKSAPDPGHRSEIANETAGRTKCEQYAQGTRC